MNTTELIRYWTMDGAAPDVGDRFRSTTGVLADTAGAHEPSAGTPDAPRMRRSDEEEWRPLLTAAGDK